MKKIIISLVVGVALSSIFGSCQKDVASEADRALAKTVEKMSVPVNSSSDLTSISYANKVLTYRYLIPGNKLENINVDALKRKAYNSLTQNVANQKLLSTVIDAKAAIKYVYYNATDSIVFTFTNEDLKAIDPTADNN